MNAVGIIAEYNPLHNGHIYHIEEARKIAGSDAVVVAMSGDYVQRGEPAILDKWERCRLALQNGADLVIEIPTLFCLGNAAQYASAGVNLLAAIPCLTHLAFGSESGDASSLELTAANLEKATSELNEGIAEKVKDGLSYPMARAAVYKEMFPEAAPLPENSNDILALEYIRAARHLDNRKLEFIAVKRRGAAYNDSACDDDFMSASGIRKAVRSGMSVLNYVPLDTAASLQDKILSYPDEWLNTLKYAVLSMSAEEIDCCPSGGEGLGNRIKSLINDASSWDELVEAVKSKRYTHTRISRLFMQIILGINRTDYSIDHNDLDTLCKPGYMRILGMNDRGREIISELRKSDDCILPVLNNINKQAGELDDAGRKQLELDVHGADIYNLVTGRDQNECSDYRMKPVIIGL